MPVTRPRIFWMPPSGSAAPQAAASQKFAVLPAPTFSRPKLWTRLDPFPGRVPPVMFQVVPAWPTVVPKPLDVMFVVTWAYPPDKGTPAAFSSAANSTARNIAPASSRHHLSLLPTTRPTGRARYQPDVVAELCPHVQFRLAFLLRRYSNVGDALNRVPSSRLTPDRVELTRKKSRTTVRSSFRVNFPRLGHQGRSKYLHCNLGRGNRHRSDR